jgi:hypothetical protein
VVEKLTLNYPATALLDIPAVSMPIACSIKTLGICGIVLCDNTAHFIVLSTRRTCVMIMPFNQLLDMIKVKCSLTSMYTNFRTIFERNKRFVRMENV